MKVRRSLLPAIVIALVVLACGPALAGPKGGGTINPVLTALYAEHAAHAAQQGGVPFTSSNPLARVVNERVVIDAVADGGVPALEAALSALGMQHVAVFGRVISGQLPISAIPALENITSLRFARPAASARRVGVVTSQGDQAMRADIARTTFGVSGAGVKVGVLSDSFNCGAGATGNVMSGDLSTVEVIQEDPGCGSGTDEGRAMLQIVHDVAPGASLAFATAEGGQANFANNILALKAIGARVIVDDVFYFAEPMFQDGIIAQAIDTVVSQGAAYFSAAGNEARRAYESPFRAGTVFTDGQFPSTPGAPHFFGGTAHNFAPSGSPDHFQRITIPQLSTLIIAFQWDSPTASACVGCPGTPNDLDIYLFDAAGTTVVDGAPSDNVNGDPVEIFSFTNNGATADFNLMIANFDGPLPGFIKYVQLGSSSITTQEFNTASGTVFGHANASSAEAVGAAAWFNTPAFGVSPPVLETFSSAGPTAIFFDTVGNRLASPVIRQKPEIVGPDGGNTTFFGSDIPQDADMFPNFFGTSAAAPHAAGVAALLLENQPALTPTGIYSTLESTALNMGPPGFDFDTGFGLVQADAALQLLASPHISLGLTLNRHTVSAGDFLQVDISAANPGAGVIQDFFFVILVPPAVSTSLGCPAGDAVVFVTDSFMSFAARCTATAAVQTFPALAQNVSLPVALPLITVPGFFNAVLPVGTPAGSYTFAIFTTPHGAFADGNVGPTDISAFASDQVQVSQ
jgi:subtilisin family serine protease